MRQNFIAQFIQLLRVGCMTCGQALSWRRIGPILLTSIGCRHCSFWCISSICWAYFSDAMVFTRIQKAVVDQSGNRPPNSDHDLFWEELWSFFLVQALSCLLSFSLKIHFSLHVTIWSRNGLLLLLHTIKEEQCVCPAVGLLDHKACLFPVF